MKNAKMIFGTFLTVLLIGALAYFTGFLANLFKAFDNTPFHPPPTDFVSTFFALSEWRYVQSALITLGIIFLIIAFIVIKNRIESRNFDDRNFSVSEKGTYGTAKYLSENQAKKLVTADKANKLLSICGEIGENDKGIILGKFPNGKTVFKQVIPKENMNMFVCGAPGSGKSYMFVRPYLAQCIRRKESFVCTDPSGELLESMGGYAKSCGYKVKVFNLVDPEKSDSWNVTGEVGIDQMLVQIAVSTIIQNTIEGETPDPFWDNGEKNLLKSLLLYINSSAYTGNKSLGELYQLLAADNFSDTLECLKSLVVANC
ncbi:type IV secretory system conjugative DNA transfer family protein [Methanobrevibacter sp.]|uniref:type IV secretory system conjugative DNA transfer family protein n=1 Tax=Methanobrevibacter sp. TaxID=66852 RepID=UPI0038708D4F